MEYFICEIIKPIKRRSITAALNKNKSMNKVLSAHTCIEHCLYQYLRDGQCCNGKDPQSCKTFLGQTNGVGLEQTTSELKNRLKHSIVLRYRNQADRNKIHISVDSETEEVFVKPIPFPPMNEDRKRISPDGVVSYMWFDPQTDRVTKTKRIRTDKYRKCLKCVAVGGWLAKKSAAKSVCTECGEWVRYPHDTQKVTVKCWLCLAGETLEQDKSDSKTPDIKTKEEKPNGKRTSIPKRKKAGRRNSRA